MSRSAAPERVRAYPRGRRQDDPDASTDLVRTAPRRLSRLCRLSPAVDEPDRLLCAERGDHPVRRRPTAPPRAPHPRAPIPEGTERRPDSRRRTPCRPAPPSSRSPPPSPSSASAPRSCAALAEAGIERTFAIQELTLPLALAGEDVIGQARTGMGKTLGFGVPLLQRVIPPAEQPAATPDGEAADRTKDVPQALVVVPTRELCVQVAKDLADAGAKLGVRVTAIYGGRAYEPQLAALRKGVDVVVGTPGRLLDLAEQRHLVLGRVKALVLDEADEMLDLGFLPDVERILRMLPEQRQTMLFSATMPGPIIALSRTFLTRPTHIRAEEADQGSTHEHTTQLVYRAHAMDKVELLTRVLQAKDRGLTMIFARTKRTVQRVADDLADRGFAAAAVHGDLGQGAREQALRAFRSGKVDVLVATDVAARGIDVTDVTHVVNYQCPEDAKTYVHRIGRTGRAGKTGVAVTLVDWDELHKWKTISDDLGLDMPEAPETYSTSAHLYTDLDIAADATGRLPHSQAHPCRPRRRVRRHRGRPGGPSAPGPPRRAAVDQVEVADPAPRPAPRPDPQPRRCATRCGWRDRRRRADRGRPRTPPQPPPPSRSRGRRSRRRREAAPPSPPRWHPRPSILGRAGGRRPGPGRRRQLTCRGSRAVLPPPERRRRVDVVATVGIVVVRGRCRRRCCWATSRVAGTVSAPAATPVPLPPPAVRCPCGLRRGLASRERRHEAPGRRRSGGRHRRRRRRRRTRRAHRRGALELHPRPPAVHRGRRLPGQRQGRPGTGALPQRRLVQRAHLAAPGHGHP